MAEATAVNTVRYLAGGSDVTAEQAQRAADVLARSAHRRLAAGLRGDGDVVLAGVRGQPLT